MNQSTDFSEVFARLAQDGRTEETAQLGGVNVRLVRVKGGGEGRWDHHERTTETVVVWSGDFSVEFRDPCRSGPSIGARPSPAPKSCCSSRPERRQHLAGERRTGPSCPLSGWLRTDHHRRGMRNGSIACTQGAVNRSIDRLSCTAVTRSPSSCVSITERL